MHWPRGLVFTICSILLLIAPVGCSMGGRSNLDEERDPHYLEGESREASKDASGAAEAYQRALENDPNNASAHKKLGILFSQHLDEPDAAIYHFKKLLKLRPNDPHADVVKQHITLCRQKLAQTVAIGPLTKQTQEDMLRLNAENTRLQNLVSSLNQQLIQLRAVAQAVPATSAPPASFVQPVNPQPGSGLNEVSTPPVASRSTGPSTRNPAQSPQAASARSPQQANANASSSKPTPSTTTSANRVSHKVKSGDTFKGIAAQYGVTTRAIILANPNVDPKRIRPGQVIVIPERPR